MKKPGKFFSILRAACLWTSVAVLSFNVVNVYPEAVAAPPCSKRYTVDGGVVTDKDTGLEWQQTVGSQPYLWSGAKDHCKKDVMLDGGDWCLPSAAQLHTLFDDTKSQAPYIDTTVFFGDTGPLWTVDEVMDQSLQDPNNPDPYPYAWAVDFNIDGGGDYMLQRPKLDLAYQTRCVRCPPPP